MMWKVSNAYFIQRLADTVHLPDAGSACWVSFERRDEDHQILQQRPRLHLSSLETEGTSEMKQRGVHTNTHIQKHWAANIKIISAAEAGDISASNISDSSNYTVWGIDSPVSGYKQSERGNESEMDPCERIWQMQMERCPPLSLHVGRSIRRSAFFSNFFNFSWT